MYDPYEGKGMDKRMTCLREEIIPLLKRDGYQIGNGEISLLETMTGYQQGEREVDTGIRFDMEGQHFYSRNGVELLILLQKTPEEMRVPLLQWFAALQEAN
jgi:hypothetical protein